MATSTTFRSGKPKLAGLVQVTDHLYLSNIRAANDIVMVSACKITCIINATEDATNVPVPEVEYVRVPVADSPDARLGDHFDTVADKILRVAEQCGRTLVHCNAGVSRSAALCLAYLMRHSGMTLVEAHSRVKSLRPIIRPNAGFWKQLIDYEVKIHGKETVKMLMSPVGEVPDLYEGQIRGLISC
ncbi:dual specificity protein phosphatase 18 [Brienomyrus brachyistius]|uniref:dual specificity protein phosphatase 18 n=1 Tax=Brienomyrus brachyistius TaxID=42636 RepID=UPI0020B4486F|nr:dual specificity protein phosphatase 18 [Brienomyrus brachyistius]